MLALYKASLSSAVLPYNTTCHFALSDCQKNCAIAIKTRLLLLLPANNCETLSLLSSSYCFVVIRPPAAGERGKGRRKQ